MSKTLVITLIIIATAIIAILGTKFLNNNNGEWICENGAWIESGKPDYDKPDQPCGNISSKEERNEENNDIVVTSLHPNDTIISPLEIKGDARGTWFFEANFPIKLLDANGQEIATAVAGTGEDWMTENFISFSATLNFNEPPTNSGVLVLMKDNPSGLPENDKQITIPVNFAKSDSATIKIFFSNSKKDPDALNCNETYAIERIVPATAEIGRAAINELLAGPTLAEEAEGYFTSINADTGINSLIIADATARIDFNANLEKEVGGSCRVAAIRSQIINTLAQFPAVDNVIISVDGRSEDILQP